MSETTQLVECFHDVCPGVLHVPNGPRRGTYKCECACHIKPGQVVCPLDGAYCDYCVDGECESEVKDAEAKAD